jgi:polyribonucleotide nucleotidyltransferase
MKKEIFTTTIGNKELTAEFNDLTNQANGSVLLHYGDTSVLVTAVMGDEREGLDYFPLSVEFEERFYSAGAILGSRFRKREGMPSDEAVLSARAVDRTVRPLFDHAIRRDIQVVVSVVSLGDEDPDILGIIGASLALGVSDIPWAGPVGAVRIGKKNGSEELIINPNYSERENGVSECDVVSCGKDGKVNMIEVGGNESTESLIKKALTVSVDVHNTLQKWQEDIIAKIGKKKIEIPTRNVSKEIRTLFEAEVQPKMLEYVFGEKGAYTLKEEWMRRVTEELPEASKADAGDLFEEKIDELVHTEALKNNKRQDGRAMDEIRELYAQAGGFSNMVHGTGIFYRGGTHVLSALTLGGPGDAQLLDTIENQNIEKHYMHHYNFPPFSVGETGRIGGSNRRSIGHGALAEKALMPVLPSTDEFPYTIRVVSEVMASNGSSSQASVCGSTLALMDAGVPIKRPVAGIAMGMMSDKDGNYKILTDIQGPEDHFGDMDLKVAGTTEGITAMQMDVKIEGVTVPILVEALEEAKKARVHILEKMKEAIAEPRANIHPKAPKILTFKVKVDQIGLVIGGGGKTINGIKDDTGVEDITINDDGSIFITGKDGSAEKALELIEGLVHEHLPGEMCEGEVVKILDFGAFVKIGPNAEGMVHVSEIAPFRIENIRDALSEGEKVKVAVKEIDDRGRINLSIKAADPEWAEKKGLKPNKKNTPSGK